jgi:hypothetical protein
MIAVVHEGLKVQTNEHVGRSRFRFVVILSHVHNHILYP